MNNKNNYDWDEEFQKLNLTLTEMPTIQTHWKTKEGKPIKYAEMSNKHLINTLRLVCLRTTEEENNLLSICQLVVSLSALSTPMRRVSR